MLVENVILPLEQVLECEASLTRKLIWKFVCLIVSASWFDGFVLMIIYYVCVVWCIHILIETRSEDTWFFLMKFERLCYTHIVLKNRSKQTGPGQSKQDGFDFDDFWIMWFLFCETWHLVGGLRVLGNSERLSNVFVGGNYKKNRRFSAEIFSEFLK